MIDPARPEITLAGGSRNGEQPTLSRAHRDFFIQRARRALLRRLLAGETATADDFAGLAGPLPDGFDLRFLGTVPGQLSVAKLIRSSAEQRSTRPSRRSKPVKVWQLADRVAAVAWLDANPELPGPEPEPAGPSLADHPSLGAGTVAAGPDTHRDPLPPGLERTPSGIADGHRPVKGAHSMPQRKRLSDILKNSQRERLDRSWLTIKAAADLKPLPPGEYRCRVMNGELFNSKSGTPGYKLTLEVIEGEHAGRRLWDDHWFTDAALSMTKRDLAKLGIERTEQMEQPLPDGIIVAARVALRRGDDGSESNRITRFHVVAVEPTAPDPFAPTDEPAETDSADAGGFDWAEGEHRNGAPTP